MFTRRQFLEDSILATTAALAGPALAASAAQSMKAFANERLSVAVIGTGIRGPVHAGAFAGRGDCDVVAICDADSSRAGRHADAVSKRQNRKVAAHQDLRKIIVLRPLHSASLRDPDHCPQILYSRLFRQN